MVTTTKQTSEELPRFDRIVERIVQAEECDGWLIECAENGCYLAISDELINELVKRLGHATTTDPVRPIVELGSGNGQLAEALCRRGVPVVPTDVDSTVEARKRGVLALSARDAIARFRPTFVLASFPPVDAEISQAIIASPTVVDVVVLQSTTSGLDLQSFARQGWSVRPLDEVSRWMLTRHDVLVGQRATSPLIVRSGGASRSAAVDHILQHGQAWWLRRGDHVLVDL